jgi:hypothetical protein
MERLFTAARPASLPEQPQMHGGKGRKEHLYASYLCLTENAGLPKQDSERKAETCTVTESP